MINICVTCMDENTESVKLLCNGCCKGKRRELREEMVGVLLSFDEVANGEILCDAFGEFLEEKLARKAGKGKYENTNDDNA